MSNSGLENLKRAAAEHASQIVSDLFEDAKGQSPIEKLFFAALMSSAYLSGSEYTHIYVASTEDEEVAFLAGDRGLQSPTIVIRPQAQLDGWRVDFLIHSYDFARKGGPQKWRGLIVECDGHDFHERTKEQAAKDRSRDRQAQLSDLAILRFTGSEIHKDAWGCAAQVTDWAAKGFP